MRSAKRPDHPRLAHLLLRLERAGKGDDRPLSGILVRKISSEKTVPAGPHGRKGLLIVVGGMKKEDGIHCSETTAKAFFRTISVPEHATRAF